MKYIKTAVILLIFSASSCGKAQSVTQTWIDPCTNTVQTATFPINGAGVLIMYRGQSKTFTAQQASSGELMLWINQVTTNIPCPITNNPVVTQTTTQAAAQAASQAASAAASAAASTSASTTTVNSTPSTPAQSSTSSTESSSSSSSGSGESSSSENKSES